MQYMKIFALQEKLFELFTLKLRGNKRNYTELSFVT